MATVSDTPTLESRIAEWRDYLGRRQAVHPVDVAELEDHLRAQVAAMMTAGLDVDEAFLIAVKRMGDLDSLSREFAREHSERLWKQLVVISGDDEERNARTRMDAIVVFALAVAAAVAVKLPLAFGLPMDSDAHAGIYLRNASLFALPFLTAYFVWKRHLDRPTITVLVAAFVAAAVFANVYPLAPAGNTEILTALHLPIALWLAVGIAYAGGRWGTVARRMDFVRFSGELAIYYVLIALGGGLLTGFVTLIFQAIGIDVATLAPLWLLPCGAAGAVLIGAWLVEAKQSVIENMAPVLTRLFTPLFAAALLAFLGAMLWTGRGVDIARDVLIAFDLLLVVVLALLLYAVTARDPQAPPGWFDALQIMLVLSALAADAVALWAISARISAFGFTPNRVAALGENVILLVNLAWSAVLYLRFARGHAPFARLERWQAGYLPVYAAWAALVVVVFPPLFGYI